MKGKKESFFWASYSDLMTSLFFVMLVLFILTITLLHKKMIEMERDRIATKAQLDKIKEVQKSTENIDKNYFQYRQEYKKHVLTIPVWFTAGSASMSNINGTIQNKLKNAGHAIEKLIAENSKDNIKYLLIIEGQASKDNFGRNYQLSYERALELKQFWENNGIDFGDSCEVLVCGSGDGRLSGTGFMREGKESANQRFLIHIVPKHGEIKEE